MPWWNLFGFGSGEEASSGRALALLNHLLGSPARLLGLYRERSTIAIVDRDRDQWIWSHRPMDAATPSERVAALLATETPLRFEELPAFALADSADTSEPLKPLLWCLGLRSGHSGLMNPFATNPTLSLRAWPYLVTTAPASSVTLVRVMRDGVSFPDELLALQLAPPAETCGLLNACLACGFLRITSETSAPTRGLRSIEQVRRATLPVNSGHQSLVGMLRKAVTVAFSRTPRQPP